jgi:GrpB-like predicted nucleotidyltransferase (UPF0157 family)
MKIELHPYNDQWPAIFNKEAGRLRDRLGEQYLIRHVGSTAVPGLAAKPIVDILIGAPAGSSPDDAVGQILEDADCYYLKYWEHVLPFRRFFIKFRPGTVEPDISQTVADERVFDLPSNGRICHFHMVMASHPFFREHLRFRDILRRDEKARRDYEALKSELAEREWESGADYARAKTGFIKGVLAENGMPGQ